MKGDEFDPKALVREAYAIDGITEAECKSIFLDWALSLPQGADTVTAINALLARHDAGGGHPMTAVLRDGLDHAQAPKRRGGWRGRRTS